MSVTRAVVLLSGVLVLARAAPVRAVEEFSRVIRDEYGLREQPSCTFCHTRRADGLAADAPFGAALKDHGFARKDGNASLRSALRLLESQGVDSDDDGVSDIEEIRAEADPNDPTHAGVRADAHCATLNGAASGSSILGAWLAALMVLMARRWIGRTSNRRQPPVHTDAAEPASAKEVKWPSSVSRSALLCLRARTMSGRTHPRWRGSTGNSVLGSE